MPDESIRDALLTEIRKLETENARLRRYAQQVDMDIARLRAENANLREEVELLRLIRDDYLDSE